MTKSSTSLSTSAHLRLDGVSLSYPGRRVLTDVSLVVSGGERVGLIGENGSGKSTLLRIAAGILPPDAGSVTATAPGRDSLTRGLLHQQPPFDADATVASAIDTAVAPARQAVAEVDRWAVRLSREPDEAEVHQAYAETLEQAENLAAWTVDARIDAMLDGLGLANLPRSRRTGELSGGQRARLSLAWLLLRGPDVLLLDEPTNHLDDAATAHLRTVLDGWRGPVLIASHDRAFLDEVVTALVDLDPSPLPQALVSDDDGLAAHGLTRYSGRYSDYLAVRRDERARWEQRFEDEQAELSRLRASVRHNQVVGHPERGPRTESRMAKKFYADRNAKVVARRVNDARSRLDELRQRQLRRPPDELAFAGFTAAGRPGAQSGPLLLATDVSVAGRSAPASLAVAAGEKWLITGPNGCGKSTLLNLLAGALVPTAGSLQTKPGIRIGILGQEVALTARHRTATQLYTAAVGEQRATEVPLSTFGLLSALDARRPVETLSLGQQRRLELAIVLANPPDVLLLDEPTNHLSLSLVTALETAIDQFPGAVVLASHDRWLRGRWPGRRLALG